MQEGLVKELSVKELSCIMGGALFPGCSPWPEPPPDSVWLPPNPDNPTANAPTTLSPD
jgi:bacteriocin-like protein